MRETAQAVFICKTQKNLIRNMKTDKILKRMLKIIFGTIRHQKNHVRICQLNHRIF